MRRLALLAIGLASADWVLGPPALAQDLLCQDPGILCRANLSTHCLARLGAGALAAAGSPDDADCARQRGAYADCIAEAAERCGGGRSADGACEAEDARLLFESAERAGDCLAYNTFVRTCLNALYAPMAEAARLRLGCGEYGLFKPYADEGAKAGEVDEKTVGPGPAPADQPFTDYWRGEGPKAGEGDEKTAAPGGAPADQPGYWSSVGSQ